MNSKKYALVVDKEVFDIIDLESAPQELIDRCAQGFSARVFCLDVTDLSDAISIGIGSTYKLGNFDNSNLLMNNKEVFDNTVKRKYCFISNEKVFLIVIIENDFPQAPIWENAFKSKITIIDISEEKNVSIGDIYHDKKFYAFGEIELEKINTPWNKWRENLGNTRPWDLFVKSNKEISEDEQSHRLSICKTCPFLIKQTNQCKQCGCFMNLKVKLSAAECPIGKW